MDAPLAAPLANRRPPLPLRLLGDERLARLVGSGHEAAFSVLYERHHQALYRYCRPLVGSDADAQDVLQAAMTSALVALRISRRDAPLRPWLFRIVYNESMTLLRRRRPTAELSVHLPSGQSTPHEAVEQRQRLRLLTSDLRELPERQRGALVMRELSGLSHAEVAQVFGISQGAAKQTVLEARRSLMEFAEGRSMACNEILSLISDGDRRALRGRRVQAHLRDCSGCAAFSQAISQRKADLHALSPVLPATAAAGILVRIASTGSGHGTSGGASLSTVTASKIMAMGASGKLLAAGAVVVATAALGTSGVLPVLSSGTAVPTRAVTNRAPAQDAKPAVRHSSVQRRPATAWDRHSGRTTGKLVKAKPGHRGKASSTGTSAAGGGRSATHHQNPDRSLGAGAGAAPPGHAKPARASPGSGRAAHPSKPATTHVQTQGAVHRTTRTAP